MLEGWHQDRQKEKLSQLATDLQILRESHEDQRCPGCRHVIGLDEQHCPSCGLLVLEKQEGYSSNKQPKQQHKD